MLQRYNSTGFYRTLDDVGMLVLPLSWRLDARYARFRPHLARAWHEEELQLPLESVAVEPERVLYRNANLSRKNSMTTIAQVMSEKVVPLVVEGGNTMSNVVERLQNEETTAIPGYDYSRIVLARRVLMHLQTEPTRRSEHHHGANLRTTFCYTPPEGEAFKAFVEALRTTEDRQV